MGLDIIAYGKLRKVAGKFEKDKWGEPLSKKVVQIVKSGDFPRQMAGIEPGYYWRGEEVVDFRAGSYHGYSEWRNRLAVMAGHGSAEEVWEGDKEGPFTELINFSDCEGVIGPKVSAKLAKDFARFQGEADRIGREDGRFKEVYDSFRRAFETASDGGAVLFI